MNVISGAPDWSVSGSNVNIKRGVFGALFQYAYHPTTYRNKLVVYNTKCP